MRSKVIFSLLGVMVVTIFIMVIISNFNNAIYESSVDNKQVINNNLLTMMYETDYQSGEYQITSDSTWPESGYTFNENLSKCENGSILSWDEENKKVLMQANTSDKCYVYFDKEPGTFANYIKSLYTTQGANNLYLHDSTLPDGAEDGSYRYSGSSEEVNNYVCFGSDIDSCPEENLYRIIGVFDDNVKLVKATSYGEYQTALWSAGSFDDTEAYTALNETFYNSLDVTWKNMIIDYNWISSYFSPTSTSSLSLSNNKNYSVQFLAPELEGSRVYTWYPAKNWFEGELNSEHSLNMKIATFSISELRYSSSIDNWNLDSFDVGAWLFNNESEGTYLYEDYYYNNAKNSYNYIVNNSGILYANSSACHSDCDFFPTVVRPCFYLDSNVLYVSGDGAISDPFRIAM